MDAKRSEITRIVEPELFEDEELLWAGRPRPARLAMKSLPTFLFGGFWLMIVLFIFGVQGFVFYSGGFSPRVFVGPGMCFGLIIPFFLLIGVGMLLAPLWGYYKGSRTVYALTDRRVIVIEPSWTTSPSAVAASRWWPTSATPPRSNERWPPRSSASVASTPWWLRPGSSSAVPARGSCPTSSGPPTST